MLVHNLAWRGGAFYHAFGFAKHLAQRGHNLTLLAIAPQERWRFTETYHDGVRVVETPDLLPGMIRSGWDPWDTFKRAMFLRSRSCDIVHCVDTRPAVILPALLSCYKVGAKLITDWTDWFGREGVNRERPGVSPLIGRPFSLIETFFEETFHRKADSTIVVSSTLFDRACRLGVSRDHLALIRPGCDTERLKPMDKKTCRLALGFDLSVPVVGFLGALTPRDGALLFAAMKCVRQFVPSSQLLLIGNHRLVLSNEQKQKANIIETAFVPAERMSEYLGACDVLVSPMVDSLANRARWPSKVNDYLAVGRPIVATRVGDVAEVIKEYRVGLTTEPDHGELAQALVSLLNDVEMQCEMGRNARNLAEQELSWTNATSALESLYYTVLPQGK
jgi:glycosyltransferase involved in cell wall biosynthesis